MSVKIQLRRDISSVWIIRNPILALGEPGFETDTHKLKIGDGTTAWNSLNYISDGFSGVGGPLDYTYVIDTNNNSFVANNPITNLKINPTSHDIDFSPYYNDLIDNSYAINMTLTKVEDANKAILLKCKSIVDMTGGAHPYYSFDVTELSRSASFTGFETSKKYYLNIDIKGDSAKFQIASVDLHNGGVQTAQVLQFDNNALQSVITGPTPPSGNNSQRIIIQGQRAQGGGEGGDVYVWGGDSDANGGDIKIYAGDADNVSPDNGYGGYVNIDGGKGATKGGNVEITGGYSQGGEGGNVNIVGGGTSSGVAGVVNIVTNYGSWIFGSDGELTFPGNITFPDNSTQTTAYVPSTPSPTLNSIAGLTTASDNYIYTTAPDVYTTGTITDFGRSLVDDTNSSDARSTLGLTIGTDVQAHNEALNKVYKLYCNTTTNSNTVLTTNGESVGGSNRLIIPPHAAWNFNIQLVARSNSTNQANSWNFRGCLHRRNDDDTVYIVNSVIEENNLESSVSASVVADNSGKALELNVTGLSSTTIAWVATVHITESIDD